MYYKFIGDTFKCIKKQCVTHYIVLQSNMCKTVNKFNCITKLCVVHLSVTVIHLSVLQSRV